MLRSLFSSRLSTPVAVGEESKQIKTNFLLPILASTFIYLIFSLVVSIISKEYGLMVAFISSVVMLLLSWDFLRNGSLNTAVVLFLVQGFGLITSLLMFDGIDRIPQVLMVIFYLIVAGLVTTPKVFMILLIYAAALIYLMVSGVLVPLFPAKNLPVWFSFIASLVFMVALIAYAIFLTHRAMMQSIQIAEDSNKFLDLSDEEKYKYFTMVEQSPLSVFTTDLDGKIEYVNPRFSELMGYESEEILGENPRILKTEYTPSDFHEDLWKKISEDRTWIGEFINQRKDESTLYQSAIIKPLFDSSGEKTGYVAFEDDISLQKEIAREMKTMDQELKEKTGEISQLKEQIKQQSIHDQLTGLFNRAYLNEVLPREILRSTRAKNHLILIIIDIDNFRSINDQFGYSTGDLVLKRLAECVNGLAGTYDQVIRSGSDEFIFLYSGKTTELGESRSEQLRDAIEKLSIQTDQGEIKIKVSIGIAVFPLHGKKESDLLTKAEQALSISKQSGGNRVTL